MVGSLWWAAGWKNVAAVPQMVEWTSDDWRVHGSITDPILTYRSVFKQDTGL